MTVQDLPQRDGGKDTLLSWGDVVDLINKNQVHLMKRSPSSQQEYNKFNARIRAEYGSLDAYVRKELLRWDSGPKQYAFRVNDFPYALEPEIQHHVLWSPAPIDASTVKAIVDKELPNREWVWFINPVKYQSIPSLFHVHIMSRPLAP
ncbi:uncharacterized protein VTP21DRAFT_11602 [Calcarisporiella thermophila]|uniref:uncharacterized protein n=1 Tax=Calcarisporiella thermophila TaxID=911321 RepID=UPI003743EAC5